MWGLLREFKSVERKFTELKNAKAGARRQIEGPSDITKSLEIKDKMEVSETEGHLAEEAENPYLEFLKASES